MIWGTFNAFLIRCSLKVHEEQTGVNSVVIFDNAQVHKVANQAILHQGHQIHYFLTNSPFFNATEEASGKFKQVSFLYFLN